MSSFWSFLSFVQMNVSQCCIRYPITGASWISGHIFWTLEKSVRNAIDIGNLTNTYWKWGSDFSIVHLVHWALLVIRHRFHVTAHSPNKKFPEFQKTPVRERAHSACLGLLKRENGNANCKSNQGYAIEHNKIIATEAHLRRSTKLKIAIYL